MQAIYYRTQETGLPFDEALRQVASETVFTTHTPVPAGHDRFSLELVEEHLGPLRDQLGLSVEQMMGLGRIEPQNDQEPFCMTVIGLKLSRTANAVSQLHGTVSRRMWAHLWPWRVEEEVPIGHITNGIHTPSWIADQMKVLFDRYFPADWMNHLGEASAWKNTHKIDPGELWETHITLKTLLVSFARQRLASQSTRRQEDTAEVERVQRMFDPQALTIGFGRRFATYKRATLIFSDLDRLAELINQSERPVQFMFAGKAHPKDEPGKGFIQLVASLRQDPRFRDRVAFLEDYDINVCRHMVHGVDVWLNNPRRPLEASGTSGQKVVLNGGLNFSVLDGWWAEAYDGSNGFAIGTGRTHVKDEILDKRDADSLYDTLEQEIIPTFYERDTDMLPQRWIEKMMNSISSLAWRFSSDRMVMDYASQCYIPATGGLSSDMTRR